MLLCRVVGMVVSQQKEDFLMGKKLLICETLEKQSRQKLVAVDMVGAGLVTVIVSGEVGAVRMAVDAGADAANQMEALEGCLTIARPTKELLEMIDNQS